VVVAHPLAQKSDSKAEATGRSHRIFKEQS
jgi:hypothetical protein